MSSFFRRQPPPPQDDPDTEEEDQLAGSIDPELRLRTVRTASSAIAESIRSEARIQRRATKRRKLWGTKSSKKPPSNAGHDSELQAQESQQQASTPKGAVGPRRNIYVNSPLGPGDVNHKGKPTQRYCRNKVRTTKYTVVTFIPKNLYEQFRRVANLYFLALVCIQVFPIFGAAAPEIAMLPLAFILTVTAIKDGVEDYRRSQLDDEVNNSAATKLGGWRNVNQPLDPREWWEKLFNLNRPGSVSRGVRRLREKDALEGKIILQKDGLQAVESPTQEKSSNNDREKELARARSLEDIQSVGSHDNHEYPPIMGASSGNFTGSSTTIFQDANQDRPRFDSFSSLPASSRTGVSAGVVDWNKRTQGTARWERTLWKKLEVGDIVLLRDNDQIPADIIVLSTSDADGLCYVETKNLDGETNLKPRKSLKATTTVTSEEDLEHSSFVIDSEPPHANLYLYNGVLKYRSKEPPSSDPTSPTAAEFGADDLRLEPVTINNLLLRGCTVRNTSWIIGLVAFTGADTKIMLNGGMTPSKRSKIEKETNFNVIMNFLILMAMCVTTGIVAGYYELLPNTSADFYEIDSQPTDSVVLNSLITFASGLIAFQNIVPISLYISIEIVKTIQAYFISQDVDMWYEPYDTACVPKTWNISDDLGQIEYVFSDKTGTLTQNVMEFQKCSINGIPYGEGITEAMRGAAKREGRDDLPDPQEQAEQMRVMKDQMVDKMHKTFKNRYLQPDKVTLVAPNLADHLADRSNPQRASIIAFFRALAVCHTVLSDRPDPKERPFHLDYKAESPDEAALVAAARDAGFPFVGKTNTSIDIEVMGQAERYIPLRVLEFNSTRKRMSVIVRNPEGKIILYTKGADSVIYARLTPDHDPVLKEKTAKDMETFANGGLRTLCIAYRVLSEEEYFNWSRIHDAAASAVKDREEQMDKANELIEHSLLILGATALEDKLQEGVPDAIENLHRAGIKLWILTGDKLQTAIEIGFSCNLLKNDMEIMILAADNPEEARAKIEAGLNKIASVLGTPDMSSKARKRMSTNSTRGYAPGKGGGFAVVIDGDTLRYALEPDLKPLFLALGTQCDTVVCCRVSPAQKALTVKLVKDGKNAMTLSIGDGANDVAMIQEANIGCGLLGLEGSQAAMSADYAFGQFRFLTKLLLVHGRWSYIRVADMHSNFFYKNVIWTFAMFWFLFYNSFDANYLYQYTFILLYNLLFTSLPVIVMGAFDQDINAKASLAFPQLYARGIKGLEYTRTKFWLYMFDGLYQSAIIYFIPFLSFSAGASISWSGKSLNSLADLGTTVAIAGIFSANLFVGMNTRYWTVITWIAVVGSMLVMCLWVTIYSFFESIDFRDEVIILFGTVGFWTTVILSVVLSIGPRFVMKYIAQAHFPMDKDIVREGWVAGDLKDRLGVKHRYNKNKKNADLEDLSLFRPHVRETSDGSNSDRGDYEPVAPRSAPRSPNPPANQLPPVEPMSQYVQDLRPSQPYRDSSRSPPPTKPPVSPGVMSFHSATNVTRATPSPGLAPPGTPSLMPPAPQSARALSPTLAEQQQRSPRSPPPPGSRNPYYSNPSSPIAADYEMVPQRPESSIAMHGQERSTASRASRASASGYVTASDGGWDSEDDHMTVRDPHGNRQSYYGGQAI